MKLLREVNLLEDQKLIWQLNLASLPLLLFFFFLFNWLSSLFGVGTEAISFDLWTLVRLFLLMLVIVVIHEMIHGVFFKLFNPAGKVKFGFKNGMAYATSPNSFYSRGKFAVISLAPFVLITASLSVIYGLGWLRRGDFIWLAAFHAAACAGDFYWIKLIWQQPSYALVEDTEKGINFYDPR